MQKMLFVLLFLPLAASAQQPVQLGSVQGIVTEGDTGQPAAGAGVFLMIPQPVRPANPKPPSEMILQDPPSTGDPTRADARGAYTIHNVPPGTYYLLSYQPGYLQAREFVYPGAFSPEVTGQAPPPFVKRITVTTGAPLQQNLTLQRGGIVEGRILTADRPVSGMAVNLIVKTRDGRYLRTGGAAHTDPQGNFRFDALAPGTYLAFTTFDGPMVETTRGRIGTSGQSILAPSTTRLADARTVTITGPDTHLTGLDITLPTSGLHTLRGQVEFPASQSPAGDTRELLIRLYPVDEPLLSTATPLRPDGTFSFPAILDGTYTVSLESSPREGATTFSADRTSMRTTLLPPRFGPLQQPIIFAGQDPPPVTLRPAPPPP